MCSVLALGSGEIAETLKAFAETFDTALAVIGELTTAHTDLRIGGQEPPGRSFDHFAQGDRRLRRSQH